MWSTNISPSMILGLAFMACSASGPGSQPGTLRTDPSETPVQAFPLEHAHVVFYNVENLFDTENDPSTNDDEFTPTSKQEWTEDRLAKKLKHLSESIDMADEGSPVLIGLAEVENRAVVDRLMEEPLLRKGEYKVIHFGSPDERGIDVALAYRPDLELVHAEPLEVKLKDDRTRDILHVELQAEGHVFHVFVDHWPSRYGGVEKSEPKRMAAAAVLKRAVRKIRTSGTVHVLIMGDFNDSPMDRSIQEGLGASCDPKAGGLIDLMCPTGKEYEGSYNYQGHWDYLDQFIVDPELLEHVESAKAVTDDRLLFTHPKYGPSPDRTYSRGYYKGGYSDHLPIVLKFK